MKYCFDEKIDRSKNHSAKWAELGKKFGTDDLFPMWIADMDIKTAPEIVQAMKEKVEDIWIRLQTRFILQKCSRLA